MRNLFRSCSKAWPIVCCALVFCAFGLISVHKAFARDDVRTVARGPSRIEQEQYKQFLDYIDQAVKAYNIERDKDKAAAFFRAALIVDPESPEVYFALSQLEESPGTVIDLALEAIRYRPFLNPALAHIDTRLLAISDARIYETLGRAYKETGDTEKARYYLEKVLEDNTNERRMGLSYMHLGEMAMAEDPDKALDLMTKSRKALVRTDDKQGAALAGHQLWQGRMRGSLRFIKTWNALPEPDETTFMLFLRSLGFLLFCLFLYTIADKEAYSRLWFCWVPVAQWFVICDLADLPRYWTVLTFSVVFPFIGVPAFIMVKAFFILMLLTTLRAPRWIALFTVSGIPFIDLIPLCFLAFRDRPPRDGL